MTAIGIVVVVSGDDDLNGAILLRYRRAGETTWINSRPRWRVHPEVVTGIDPPPAPQFSGSVVNLRPATTYEIQLRPFDNGTPLAPIALTATTRSLPLDNPAMPNVRAVTSGATLQTALDSASAGDVIQLADGTYTAASGTCFHVTHSGTADRPIFIRGSGSGAIIDGAASTACNGQGFQIGGSHIHLESLTIHNIDIGLVLSAPGTTDNVIRRVTLRHVRVGMLGKDGQSDFYICDNQLVGLLTWPCVYNSTDTACNASAQGQHANDDGINLKGDGHVVCHNAISGFGDAIKFTSTGFTSEDVYNNEVTSSYDDAIELDGALRNVRCTRNRFTNGYAPISFQPIYGGPVYVWRNVVVNVANEALKIHALGEPPNNQDPSGMLIYHNTFVSSDHALSVNASATGHYFELRNNLCYDEF